jgi:hypothetical protein
MGWGIYRILIFGIAFLLGATLSDFWIPSVFAPMVNPDATVLESVAGTSLLVTCDAGNPKVESVGNSSGIQVRCLRSNMHVVRTQPTPERREFKPRPFTPIAVLISPE